MSEQQPFDMNALLQQAQQMTQHLAEQQAQAEATVFEGQSGGGVVKVAVSGGYEFQSVSISPAAVDPDDIDMLEDLVLAAINDAVSQIEQAKVGGMGGLDLGGIDLDGMGLGGLLGGGGPE